MRGERRPLTTVLRVRLAPEDLIALREEAEAAGVSVSTYVRRRALGRPLAARADLLAIRELRRQGAQLRHAVRAGVPVEEVSKVLAGMAAATEAVARRFDDRQARQQS
jgi:hypothetical protein